MNFNLHKNNEGIFCCSHTNHTARKSQIVCKNSIFGKITKLWIWIYVPKINEFIVTIIHWFLFGFEFSRQKLSKFNNFQLLLILYLHKITIFGAKIQIIQVILTCKYSQKSLIFSSKIQIQNFEFFWRSNFWTWFQNF